MTGFTQKTPTQAPRLSPLRLGIGGPVGSGKTALTLSLCRRLKDVYNMAVITNDIYTKEDSEFLTRHDALSGLSGWKRAAVRTRRFVKMRQLILMPWPPCKIALTALS